MAGLTRFLLAALLVASSALLVGAQLQQSAADQQPGFVRRHKSSQGGHGHGSGGSSSDGGNSSGGGSGNSSSGGSSSGDVTKGDGKVVSGCENLSPHWGFGPTVDIPSCLEPGQSFDYAWEIGLPSDVSGPPQPYSRLDFELSWGYKSDQYVSLIGDATGRDKVCAQEKHATLHVPENTPTDKSGVKFIVISIGGEGSAAYYTKKVVVKDKC